MGGTGPSRREDPVIPNSPPDWLNLHGHDALIQGLLILLGTFVLEDAATILAAMDVQVGRVTVAVALVALQTPAGDLVACVVFSMAGLTDYFDGRLARGVARNEIHPYPRCRFRKGRAGSYCIAA